MKRISIVLFLGLLCNIINAQDVIIKLNGDEINSKIIEISSKSIKYKVFDFQEGPDRIIELDEVSKIKYENGRIEVINTVKESPTPVVVEKSHVPQEKPAVVSVKKDSYDGNYFMLALGIGPSYGGSGMRVQGRFGGTTGFGIHAGIGYNQDAEPWYEGPFGIGYDEIHASAGLKFFPYKGIYINTQVSYLGKYRYYYGYDSYYGGYSYNWENEGLKIAPSLLSGVDMEWGDTVGFGFNAGLGVTFIPRYEEFYFVADLGFVIRF